MISRVLNLSNFPELHTRTNTTSPNIVTALIIMKFTSIVFISCVTSAILPVKAATKTNRRRTIINENEKNEDRASHYLRSLEEVGSMSPFIAEVVSSEEKESSSSSCPSWGDFSDQIPAIGHTTIQLIDESRNDRTIAVDIWYPAEDNGEQLVAYRAGKITVPSTIMQGVYFAIDSPKVLPPQDGTNGYPLLIFSMGSGSIRNQSARLMEHLASWGFVVCSPDHPGNSFNDPPFPSIPFSVQDRPKDVSFVIDNMLSPEYVDRFHLHKTKGVGVLGHSYGGTTSLLVAPNAHSEWSDERVKAIMPIAPAAEGTDEEIQSSGVNWGAGMSSDLLRNSLPNIVVPSMVVGGENDVSTPVDRQNVAVFDKTNGLPRFNVVIPQAGHTSFADICPLFDRLSSVLGEGMTYRLVGGGNYKKGRGRVNESYCDTNDEVQSILGYYAVAFFSAMLLLEDEEEREQVFECMYEQSVSLSTYEYLGI